MITSAIYLLLLNNLEQTKGNTLKKKICDILDGAGQKGEVSEKNKPSGKTAPAVNT